jgi:hypothetical protein
MGKSIRKGAWRKYRFERYLEDRHNTEIEVWALQGRLGLLTPEQKTAFYGAEYLTPWEKRDLLLKAAAERGL